MHSLMHVLSFVDMQGPLTILMQIDGQINAMIAMMVDGTDGLIASQPPLKMMGQPSNRILAGL